MRVDDGFRERIMLYNELRQHWSRSRGTCGTSSGAPAILFAVEFQSEIACSNAYLANYIFRLTFLRMCS